MSARSKVWGACRSLAVRSRPAAPRSRPFVQPVARPRWYSDETPNNNSQTPRVPPETNAADYLKPEQSDALPSTPGGAPAPGTNADSHIEGLGDAELEKIFFSGKVTPKEGEPGLTDAQQEMLFNEGMIPPAEEADALLEAAAAATTGGQGLVASETALADSPGFKFPLPAKPYPSDFNHKKRYHPVLDQLTRLMMRDGKLSVAQRNMAVVLNYLRTSPAPIYSPKFPLLPGTPPASHLPLNPILYITIAIDSVAPLLKVKMVSGAAGGGRALEVPMPLLLRQRRRFAFKWILDAVEKKPSKGSGRKQFPYRVAEEIVAVVEGRSSVWDKRKVIHKQGTAARANAGSTKKAKSKKSK